MILVYQMSPVTMALPAIVVKLFTRSKIVLWVQDIWPESLVANRGCVKPRGALPRYALWCAQYIAARLLSPCNRVSSRNLSARWRCRQVISDTSRTPPIVSIDRSKYRLMRPNESSSVQALTFSSPAISDWRKISKPCSPRSRFSKIGKHIQWVFIGDGRLRAWLEHQIEEQGLADNVQILGSFPPEMMPFFFAIADTLLITLRDERIFSLTIPSKLQTYLACGRPVLGAVSGEAANILAQAGAGPVASPSDPKQLAEMAIAMAQLPRERLDALARRRSNTNGNEFDRDQWMGRLESWLQELSSPAFISRDRAG